MKFDHMWAQTFDLPKDMGRGEWSHPKENDNMDEFFRIIVEDLTYRLRDNLEVLGDHIKYIKIYKSYVDLTEEESQRYGDNENGLCEVFNERIF